MLLVPVCVALLGPTNLPGSTEGEAHSLRLVVRAGNDDHFDPIIRREWPAEEAPRVLRAMLGDDPFGRARVRADGGAKIPAELRRIGTGESAVLRLTFLLPGVMSAGETRQFVVEPDAQDEGESPWEIRLEGALKLSHGGKPVLVYNTDLVGQSDHDNAYEPRNAYIHPAYTPKGATITGDFSRLSHPHHRGLFLAYTKTETGDLHPDFWNIQGGSGRIRFDRLEETTVGPVSARFISRHLWEALRREEDPLVVLDERWEVEVFSPPGTPYWLIELTSTQTAVGHSMRLPPYRYGGMAYRGPDSFFPEGVEIARTSEGLDRVSGDQKPARWVDLTGPIRDGSTEYGGAAILDHPSNRNHPTPARIHPTRIPFFCFTPSHDREIVLPVGEPVVFRYRVILHDGKPDEQLNERLWRDFAAPLAVEMGSGG